MSIKHFHAQLNKRRTEFLVHPERFSATEKLDGSNLIVGATDGKMWTARKNTTIKYFHEREWGDAFWVSNFREAHSAIENAKDFLIGENGPNFELRGEILSVNYPNTLIYKRSSSSVVFFGGHTRDFNHNCHSSVGDIPVTTDGITISRISRTGSWQLTTLEPIDTETFIPVVERARELTDQDEQARALLGIVCGLGSRFGDTRVEGLVFTHEDGWMFKLVDRDWFTATNARNQEIRRQLFRTPRRHSDSIMDVLSRALTEGKDGEIARINAMEALRTKFEEYLDNPVSSHHIHLRNLEAFASLRLQLEVGDGR